MGNFVFDAVSPVKRAQCIAIYNSANAIGIFLGASLGGNLSRWLPKEVHIGSAQFTLASNLQLLFLLSAVLRLTVSLKFLPMIREVREVKPFGAKDFFIAIAQMRPLSGFKFNLFTLGRGRAPFIAKGTRPAPPKAELSLTLADTKEPEEVHSRPFTSAE
ncbi:MAG: hypothetical protein EPO39_06110 [Candidatus Manganitrophaceae bacterium]|nr:MAG: hypothetical protein EPO39_06110 [Candidatus Manganitrophaceae bacterium]